MEVKDINSIAAMFVSNRTQKVEGQSVGNEALQNFKELFTQGNLFEFQSAEKTSITGKVSTLDFAQKSDVSAKTNAKNNISDTDKKTSAAVKENKEIKSKKAQDKPAKNVENKTSSSEANKNTDSNETANKAENNTDKVEETAENTVTENSAQKVEENNISQTEETIQSTETVESTKESETEAEGDTALISGDISELLKMILPETLETMGAVTVYNGMDNSYSVMTGEEVVDLLATSNIDINAYLSEDGRSDITLLPQNQVQAANNSVPQPILEGLESVNPEAMEIMSNAEKMAESTKPAQAMQQTENTPQQQTIVTDSVDEMALKQSEKLADVIGSDKKISVNVEVEEENFSYQSAKVTVKEVLSAADVSQTKGERQDLLSEEGTSQSQTQVQGSNNTMTSSLSNNAVSAQAMPAQDMNVAGKANIQNAQTPVVKGLSDAHSNNMTHLAGVDNAAQGLKAESGVNAENKSSFRDIYKGMSREVAEQVKVNITKSAVKGVDSIEIKLKPEELGHIEIKMQLSKDGKLQAHIIASRAETGEMLQKELPSLEKAFTDAGFSLDDGSLSFSYREENSAKEQNNELRNFIGRVLEQDAENENTPEYGVQISESWDGTSALNIRV